MAFSPRTQECFNKVLSHSLRVAASDILDASSLAESAANDRDLSKTSLSRIMLTISAIDFRMTFLLHYKGDKNMHGLVRSSSTEEGVGKIAEELDAYFLEMGNRLCGEAKRLFYESFDHLGMSTPCALSATTTFADMHSKSLCCEGHVQFKQQGKMVLAASVFVYSDSDFELDINDSQFAEQEGTGELEFF